MKWVRLIVAAGVLASVGVGCSRKDAPAVPANAPRPEDEKPLPGPRSKTAGPGGKSMSPSLNK